MCRIWKVTYRTRTGVPTQFGRLFAGGGAFGVDAGIVLRVDPLHLAVGLLEWVKAALCTLNSHLLVLWDCVQGLDDRVCSLAAVCGHLCDTYLSKKKGEKNERETKLRVKKVGEIYICGYQCSSSQNRLCPLLVFCFFNLSVILGLFPPCRALLLHLC